jgi:hypothetical protein
VRTLIRSLSPFPSPDGALCPIQTYRSDFFIQQPPCTYSRNTCNKQYKFYTDQYSRRGNTKYSNPSCRSREPMNQWCRLYFLVLLTTYKQSYYCRDHKIGIRKHDRDKPLFESIQEQTDPWKRRSLALPKWLLVTSETCSRKRRYLQLALRSCADPHPGDNGTKLITSWRTSPWQTWTRGHWLQTTYKIMKK